MAGPVLTPALTTLRQAFNLLAPHRDRSSDGWIGDAAHRKRSSDHNPDETGTVPIHDADRVDEVHAIDVDRDLGSMTLTMGTVVDFIVGRCRSGAERRLRYVIFDHSIWEASNGWRERPYDGSDPHIGHAHFSGSYDPVLEASTASWHLEEIPVSLTAEDRNWITAEVTRILKEKFERTNQPPPNDKSVTSLVGRDALDQGVPNPIRGGKTPAWMLMGDLAELMQEFKAGLDEMADPGPST